MTLQECYSAIGGNYEDVLSRLYSERLVQKFVLKFLTDGSYQLLCDSLEKKDYEEAFRAAHTIKGMCQNLSFDRLLESSSRLSDALRSGYTPQVPELARKVEEDYQQTVQSIHTFREGLGL